MFGGRGGDNELSIDLSSSDDNLLLQFSHIHNTLHVCKVGCLKKKHFQENEKYNPPSICLGVSLKGFKRIFDSTKFWGASSHFRFAHFYIVDFHSALFWPGCKNGSG